MSEIDDFAAEDSDPGGHYNCFNCDGISEEAKKSNQKRKNEKKIELKNPLEVNNSKQLTHCCGISHFALAPVSSTAIFSACPCSVATTFSYPKQFPLYRLSYSVSKYLNIFRHRMRSEARWSIDFRRLSFNQAEAEKQIEKYTTSYMDFQLNISGLICRQCESVELPTRILVGYCSLSFCVHASL